MNRAGEQWRGQDRLGQEQVGVGRGGPEPWEKFSLPILALHDPGDKGARSQLELRGEIEARCSAIPERERIRLSLPPAQAT